jgi:hypothetical protein
VQAAEDHRPGAFHELGLDRRVIPPPGTGTLSSSKSQRITISSGGQTSSYRPRTFVPHSIVQANRPSSIDTGTPSHRE